MPVDEIKIDGIFVQGMLNDPVDRTIIISVVQIGHSVGKRTVAEFVENAEVLRELKLLGVDSVQGNYVAQPLDKMEHSLENQATHQTVSIPTLYSK